MRIAGGAVAVARRLAAAAPAWCWLDGDAAPAGEPGTSYLGIAAAVRTAERGREREFLAEVSPAAAGSDPAAEAGSAAAAETPEELCPEGGFWGGWVVALGYELGVALLGLTPAPDDAAPALALRLDVVLAVTGERGELRAESDGAIDAWLARHGAVLAPEPGTGQLSPAGAAQPSAARAARIPLRSPARWRRSDAHYATDVAACKRAIGDGDAYVLCLTDTAETAADPAPLQLYERLRERGAASRGGVIVTPERSLVSASPERFLSLRGGRLATHPIKGTRPRGSTPEADLRLAEELARDPKERAENLMIVDLMRNDLARVCAPGTVEVTGFLRVETHPHVHQLVSTVSGRLAPGRGVADAIAACFPGGSMTGAPKRRAVELLAAIESGPRGLYSGCFGWVDRSGDAELAMTIRGAELRRGRVLVGAGGGITADSDPAREVAEKRLKAAAILAAIAPQVAAQR
ncbi:anthranilate synthase component 1 [Leucobacter luti]|uniref:Anthranilate synthase component 1 n=1 Tax=Leucobacter luti TaxID=340320 RepID=A0A4Q7TVQ6_9MICO|nr:anthranilate synthase component I family protein [Leucobacter luti]RZT64803.1 anthranilate synthase component 1 [Leucobacter luti]